MANRETVYRQSGHDSVVDAEDAHDVPAEANPDVAPQTREIIRKRRWPVVVLSILLVLVAIGALLFFGMKWLVSRFVTDAEPVIDSTVIVNSFEDVADLATEEYNFSGVGKFSDDGKSVLGWDVPFTGKSFLLTYSGTVVAGIEDIDGARVTINDGAEQVLVTIPAPSVLSAAIDPDTIEVYDQSFNPLNQFSVDDVTGFLSTETDKNRNDALQGGLLERAEDQAEALIISNVEAVLTGTAQEDYTVIVRFDSNGR